MTEIDPRARDLIERCDAMSAADLQELHGILRDPHFPPATSEMPSAETSSKPWWDPAVDERVQPTLDAVLVAPRPETGRAAVDYRTQSCSR